MTEITESPELLAVPRRFVRALRDGDAAAVRAPMSRSEHSRWYTLCYALEDAASAAPGTIRASDAMAALTGKIAAGASFGERTTIVLKGIEGAQIVREVIDDPRR